MTYSFLRNFFARQSRLGVFARRCQNLNTTRGESPCVIWEIKPALDEILRFLVAGESRSDRPHFVRVEIPSGACANAQLEPRLEFAQRFDDQQLSDSELKAVQPRAQFRRLLATAGIRLVVRPIARLATWILPKLDLVRSWGARSIPNGPGMKGRSNERMLVRSFDLGSQEEILERPSANILTFV